MYLNDLSIGMELTTPSVPVERAGMLAFAKDFNPCPIHMDEDYASHRRAAGVELPSNACGEVGQKFDNLLSDLCTVGALGGRLTSGRCPSRVCTGCPHRPRTNHQSDPA